MTYCVAMRLNAGLVFLSDSRTNAGMDQDFHKVRERLQIVYLPPGAHIG